MEIREDNVIAKPAVARKLLQAGFTIIDLRPAKKYDGTLDFTRSVFVFKPQAGLKEKIRELLHY